MRKGIFALESMDEAAEAAAARKAEEERATPEALAEAETDTAVAETEVEAGEIESDAAQIEEAEEVRDTVDGLADQVQERVETEVDAEGKAIPEEDRGISDEIAETLEVAVEHFRNRLGFKKKVMPALEGFKVKGKRKQVSMEALANLRDLSARTDSMISIAQEGLLAKIGNSFSLFFATEGKIKKQLEQVSKQFDVKGAKKDKAEIKEPAWGKQFPTSKTEVDAAEVVAIAKKLLTVDLRELSKLAAESVKIAKEAKMDDKVAQLALLEAPHVRALLKKAEELATKAKESAAVEAPKAGVSFKVLDAAGKKQVVAAITALLEDKAISEAENANWEHSVGQWDENGYHASKLRQEMSKALYEAARYSYVLYKQRLAIAHAAVKYIAASTK